MLHLHHMAHTNQNEIVTSHKYHVLDLTACSFLCPLIHRSRMASLNSGVQRTSETHADAQNKSHAHVTVTTTANSGAEGMSLALTQ